VLRRLLLAVFVALAAASSAHADGDPPSDVLAGQDVYYGFGLDLRSKEAAQLHALTAAARDRGFAIKVALITDYSDLGLVGQFWQKPADYVRYLGEELSLLYRGRLLIVMDAGYAIYTDGKVPGKDRRVLARLTPPTARAAFFRRAIDAVQRLARANGIRLDVPDVGPTPTPVSNLANGHAPSSTPAPAPRRPSTLPAPPRDSRSSRAWLFLAPVGLFVLAAVAAIGVSRRR
jgi:hypothetical protein